VDDLADLWAQLHARFHHQQTLFLPQTRADWINLRVLDFPDFVTFNSKLHRIVEQLRLYGETVTDAELIEKTLSTFPQATTILSQQYQNMKFKKHSTLMAQLLLAEKHQQLLLKNAEARLVREVHITSTQPAVTLDVKVEAHAAAASRRPPRGSYQKPHPFHMAREMRAHSKSDVHRGNPRRDDNAKRNPPRPHQNQFKPRNFQPFQGTCHKCGRT
jgi:hypothetical protein